jgi:S-adenosylmethionine:tRNA ribosyltransferase-isomerase
MKTSSFSFELPEGAIAQQPSVERGASRLMVLDRRSGEVLHSSIERLPDHVSRGTVMVLNKTKVVKARLYGGSEHTGGKVEFVLLEEVLPGLWKTLASKARKQLPGKRFTFPGGVEGRIEEAPAPPEGGGAAEEIPAGGSGEEFRYLRFRPAVDPAYLDRHGHVPLPPYIRRPDSGMDAERYQTVYAEDPGSAAAPTAGLHLTRALLGALEERGVVLAKLTLHVGAGTFLPIRSEEVESHRMHREWYSISPEAAQRVNASLKGGGKILAVGTTVVRALESAYDQKAGQIAAGAQRTGLFIYPGYRFRVVSQLLTNFHTPRSSLLVMVSAFAGRRAILDAYRAALGEGYHFFSYGDAMLIR